LTSTYKLKNAGPCPALAGNFIMGKADKHTLDFRCTYVDSYKAIFTYEARIVKGELILEGINQDHKFQIGQFYKIAITHNKDENSDDE
jgi:hypothetical protein